MEQTTTKETAARLCVRFSRCMNYPKTEDALDAMVNGLMRAEQMTGVPASDIVEQCLQTSMYCPTDADLLNVARDIRGPAPGEDIPVPPQAQVRKQWQALAHQFPHIAENGKVWHADLKSVCAKIRAQMGAEKWAVSSSREKVRVGIEMGMQVHVKPPNGATLEDMGVGIFVTRLLL